MRCNICDRLLTEPEYNKDIEGYEPCHTCMEVIEDTIAGYHDKASADEDELGSDDDVAALLAATAREAFPYD